MIGHETTPEEAQAIETTLYHAVIAATNNAPLAANTIHPKVIASSVVGAGVSLICGVLSLFHVQVPQDVQASLTVVLSALAGYITPSKG